MLSTTHPRNKVFALPQNKQGASKLSLLGYRVISTEVPKTIISSGARVVLLDIDMPTMDGIC
jgi:hypothetical protein